eukprot:gene13796-15214_t
MKNQPQKPRAIERPLVRTSAVLQPKLYQKNGNTLEIEPLTYGNRSNWTTWRTNMQHKAGVKFQLSDIIQGREPVITIPECDPNRYIHDRAYTVEYDALIKGKVQNEIELNSNKQRLFSYMLEHISDESEQKLSEQPTWNDVYRDKDPLALLLLLESTHVGVTTGNIEVDRERAEREYTNIRQGEKESLLEYKRRFELKVNALRNLGLEAPSNAQQSIKFIKGLDNALFASLKNDYDVGSIVGNLNYPPNIVDAYNIAVQYGGTTFKKKKVSKPKNVAYSAQAAAPIEDKVEVANIAMKKKGQKRNYNQTQNNEQEVTEEETSTQNKPKYFCKLCPGVHDHWIQNCPVLNQLIDSGVIKPGGVAAATTTTDISNTTNSSSYNTRGSSRKKKGFAALVNLTSYDNKELGRYDIALDTAATVTLIKEKSLLSNLRKSNIPIQIKAVNGEHLTTDVIGDLPLIGEAYYHPKAQISLVPLGELENKFKVHYNPKKDFTIKIESEKNIRFKKRLFDDKGNGLYIWDASELIPQPTANVLTVEENKLAYSKREIRDARRAIDLIRTLGYPTPRQLIEMIQSGTILECPVTIHDVVRAHDIFGDDIPSLKGKTTHKKTPPINVEFINKPTTETQVLHTDIMFIDSLPYLISISTPMNLLLATSLDSRAKEDIAPAIINHINTYKSEGFTVKMVLCDGEGGIIVAKELLNENGVILNLSPSSQHVPSVERSIRTIKERMRCILASLPFRVPKSFMKHLVNYVINKINSLPKSTVVSNISPREIFTGRKINYKRDLRFGFGDYCQIETPSVINKNSVRIPRTEGAIAVCPTGNLQGSVIFYLLSTGKFVTRDHFKVLPMPDHVIERLNQLAGPISRNNYDIELPNSYSDDESDGEENDLSEFKPNLHSIEDIDTEGPNIQPDEDYETNENNNSIPINTVVDEDIETRRYPMRERKPVDRLSYAARKHQSIESTIKRHAEETVKAVYDEMNQMVNKEVFTPIDSNVYIKDVIHSFMFMKEKFKSNGEFDKIKARLAAGGNEQSMSVMSTSSPTVSLQAIFMTAAIAAKEKRKIASCDVPGAYLNASMIGNVYMRLDEFTAAILCKIKPEYINYLRSNGTMIVKLDKALYGCVESAKLWYDTFANTVRSYGFVPNELEPCVFNKDVDDKQVTICLYVDDLMITSETAELLDDTIKFLEKQFHGLSATIGNIHSYLGMTFNFETSGEVKITTERYINEIIKDNNIKGISTVPASSDLFEIGDSSELDPKRKEIFHSVVAKLLYISKRTRPDILTAISFLTTRVTKSTERDWSKLQKVLRYLNGTRELGIILSPNKGKLKLQTYVDASYGTHVDGKSHSGLYIALGKGPVFVKSSKQKIVSKSSTEAELIALSDACSQVIWSRDFLINQGYDLSSVTIFEDNKSTLALVHNGKSTSERTKHINVRYHFIKDKIESGEIEVQYMSTDQMIADVLTKPLPGKKFIELRNKLLNWHY